MQRLMPTGLLTDLALDPGHARPSGISPAEPSTMSEGSDGSSQNAPADPPSAEPTGEAGTSALRAPVLSYPASQAVHHPTLPGLGTRTEDWQKDRKIEKSLPDKLGLDDPMQVRYCLGRYETVVAQVSGNQDAHVSVLESRLC